MPPLAVPPPPPPRSAVVVGNGAGRVGSGLLSGAGRRVGDSEGGDRDGERDGTSDARPIDGRGMGASVTLVGAVVGTVSELVGSRLGPSDAVGELVGCAVGEEDGCG